MTTSQLKKHLELMFELKRRTDEGRLYDTTIARMMEIGTVVQQNAVNKTTIPGGAGISEDHFRGYPLERKLLGLYEKMDDISKNCLIHHIHYGLTYKQFEETDIAKSLALTHHIIKHAISDAYEKFKKSLLSREK